MAYHVLSDVDRHMCLPVVDADGHRHHFREDHRSTGPGLDHTAVTAALHRQHFLSERFMNVGPLFSWARHLLPPPTSIATPNDELSRSLVVTRFVTESRLAARCLRLSPNWLTAC